jgi:hypothetical protein
MRGGALPLITWGLILTVLYALNVVWTGQGLNAAICGFAVAATIGTAVALILLRPNEALKRGEPQPESKSEASPSASFGAVLLAVGVGSLVYGFAFGHFLVYFGAGLIVVSLGILAREQLAQRRALRRWRRKDQG